MQLQIRQVTLIFLDTRLYRRIACWDSFGPPAISAQCPRDTVMHVARAGLNVHMGAESSGCTYSDDDCGCRYGDSGCSMPNVHDLCMGQMSCRLDVSQQYIHSNFCRGFTDYMYIEYNCVPGMKLRSPDSYLVCLNVVFYVQ